MNKRGQIVGGGNLNDTQKIQISCMYACEFYTAMYPYVVIAQRCNWTDQQVHQFVGELSEARVQKIT